MGSGSGSDLDLDLDGSVLDMEKSGEILVSDESMMFERIGELSLMIELIELIELIGEKKGKQMLL